jgi:hypothetical protein
MGYKMKKPTPFFYDGGLDKKPTIPSVSYKKSNEQENTELDAKEDAMAVENPTKPKKKVMVDGNKTNVNDKNGVVQGNWQPHQFRK